MNRELDLVLMLEPELREAGPEEMARQRSRLLEAIDAETVELVAPPTARRHRRRSVLFRTLAVAAALAAVGGGTAFAVSSLQPDSRQSGTVERQQTAAAGNAHIAGWRPELDAEHVVCDYRNLGREAPLVYTYANEFPLATPLTEQRIVGECRSGTDAVRGAPVVGAALLCSVTPPRERFPVPAVTFSFPSCAAAQLDPAPPTLIDDRNRLRRAETAIRAVPQQCPTAAQSLRWVRAQVAATSVPLRILDVEQYPGGRCYVPDVHWGLGTVEISALISAPVSSGSKTTPTTVVPSTTGA
jgi:hypothetical protein